MALKKKQQESTGSGIDYNFLHSQVEDDTHEARVSVIIDAGLQQPSTAVYGEADNKENVMYFTEHEDALNYVEEAEEIIGTWLLEDKGYDEIEEEDATSDIIKKFKLDAEVDDEIYKVPFQIVTPKEREEVIYAVDLVDTRVKYKEEDEEEKQFRIWLNKRDFKSGILKGFSTKFSPPKKKGAKWTFSPLSMHTKLANATGQQGVVDPEHDDFGDLSLFLDEAVGIQTTQQVSSKGDNEYVNLKTGAPTRLPKKVLDMGVSELDCTPEAIDWEEVTVEQLMNVKPNKLVIDKLKSASNYEGSQMQAALEEYEEIRKAEYENKDEDEGEEDKPEAKKTSKKEKTKDESKKKKKPKKAKKSKGDDPDDDIPF